MTVFYTNEFDKLFMSEPDMCITFCIGANGKMFVSYKMKIRY